MTTLNAYATLAEYKAWVTVRGGTLGTDSADDTVIETILKGVSRYIESMTGRTFWPYIETRYYDVPSGDDIDPRVLLVDGDLLEVLSLTNGDAVAIASTEYDLVKKNRTPYYGIRLKDNSTYAWASDGAGNTHVVIAVSGIWGYHNKYNSNAWLLGSTLNEALDNSETGIDVVSGTLFAIGQLIRFENELSYVSGIASNTLTGTRGENGSTAAAHDTAKSVYIWQAQDDIKQACLTIAQNVYALRSGQSGGGRVTVTAAGVVIRPEEVPALVQNLLLSYRNIL